MSITTISAHVGFSSLRNHGALLAGTVVLLVGAGCSAANVANPITGGKGQGGGNGSCGVLCNVGGGGGSAIVIVGDPKNCGNSSKDFGEGCDDGNTTNGDGCNSLCQIEADWTCPNPGQPCQYLGVCGNGVLTSNKECDDGNTKGGDGCSSTCKLEPGWSCRVAGKPCTPTCGDGKVELGKQCDDGNDVSGDGCSSTCQIEPGASCTGSPSVCTKGVCGNGAVETGEACDCGTDPAKLPKGCTGPNGLFNGDGTGCSKTCTVEPICRGTNGTGATHACAATCGNGNLETGEECDDSNLIDGDGCSKACKIEGGFTCTTQTNPDTQPCTQTIYSGQCLELPVKYRDFESEKETNGHPDFFYYGAALQAASVVSIAGVAGQPGAVNYNKRYCVPNSAGPARQNDATQRCWGMSQANLGNNGRPAFDTTRNGGGANATLCDCQFTDWSHDTNGGHVPGYTQAANGPTNGLTYNGGANGHPMYKGLAPIVTSADTFAQWWTDSKYTNNTHIVSTLELGPVAGQTNLYRYSSAPHSIYGNFFPLDPPANNFPIYSLTGSTTGPGTVKTSTTGNNEPLLCNLWPYWYSSTTFGAGAGCKADQYVFPPSFAPGADPAAWFGMHPGGDWIPQAQGWFHDSWFSVEARYLFAFNGDFQLQFFGDDDTFVFINGMLVIDLGGVHQRLPASVKVAAATGNATIQEGGNVFMPCTNPPNQTVCPVIPAGFAVGDLVPCDGSANAKDPVTKVPFNSTCPSGSTTCDCRQRQVPLGLKTGNTYEIAVFQRDGHPTESNFQLTLSGFSTTESVCQPRCGDGVVSGGEECDCGDGTVPVPASCSGQKNDDTVYGGCTTQCKWGPYCGDGIPQSPQEQCDKGKLNGSDNGPDGCMFGCLMPHRCGDGSVDTNLGEVCDLGALNGVPLDASGNPTTLAAGGTVECTADCKTVIQ